MSECFQLTFFHSQLLNEIMPMIYKRFTEKSAEEWRQIYKALQLMEFLVKNGSERVIDDARSHLSLLKMLKQFHYIDQNGKDQGINVRNRSKELTDLLSDVDRIRQERKKARATKHKYGGVEGGMGLGGSGISSSGTGRYGGFGSESASSYAGGYGGSTRGVYGDGGGFGGESHEDYDAGGRTGGADRFDEYDEYDDGGAQAAPGRRRGDAPSSSSRTRQAPKKAEPPKPKEPEVDLFDFGDDEPATSAPVMTAPSSSTATTIQPPTAAPAAAPADDDDDFDDFQSATPAAPAAAPTSTIPKPNYSSFSTAAPTAAPSSSTTFAQPSPQPGTNQADFSNLFATRSPASTSAFSPPPQNQQQKPATGYQPSGPNYFTSVPTASAASPSVTAPGSGLTSPQPSIGGAKPAGKKPAGAGGDAFASLLSGSNLKKNNAAGQAKGMTIADMAKQKSQAGLYGANAAPAPAPANGSASGQGRTGGSAMDDLLG